jgi:hypothetical protein
LFALEYVMSILEQTRTIKSSEARSMAITLQCHYFKMFGKIAGKFIFL